MNKFLEFCLKARVVGVEIVELIVFAVFLFVAARYEIVHLLRK